MSEPTLIKCDVHAEHLNCRMRRPDCEGWTVQTIWPEGKSFEDSDEVVVRVTHRISLPRP